MTDLAFYEAGCHDPKGVRHALVASRRLLRRILRPIFQRQVELFQHLIARIDEQDHAARSIRQDIDHLNGRHEHLAEQVQATLAFGWDYVAMARRLAVLEDRVEALLEEREAGLSESRSRVA